MCRHIAIAFLSLCFVASTLAAPQPVKCPAASKGCSFCVATVGCSFVASYGSTPDSCQLATTTPLPPASAIYTTAAQCKVFTNAVTEWNNIKSHVLNGDKPTTRKPIIDPTNGRHLLSNFNTKNGGLKPQLSDIGNVDTATKIMLISLPDRSRKTLWVDESGATALGLTTLTEPFWSLDTVQQVCQAAIVARSMYPSANPDDKIPDCAWPTALHGGHQGSDMLSSSSDGHNGSGKGALLDSVVL
ncbi:hypothetical protein C8R46DRAFT_1295565 [Mycena filopes]|nr:hypothetical protein C8R46DRAFT_1295565 [Mycena filopes]